jgi:hypothetical protein
MKITTELTGRERALLRAVAAGRCELTASREPDLLVDGMFCSDQLCARRLVRSRLVTRTGSGSGRRTPAALSDAGWTALSGAAAA